MTDKNSCRFDPDDFSGDIESLIRNAKGYIQVSDELRPRLVESARLQHRERRIRRHIERFAAVALLIGALAGILKLSLEPRVSARREMILERGLVTGDSTWNLVDAITEQRRRQASVFGTSFSMGSPGNSTNSAVFYDNGTVPTLRDKNGSSPRDN